jgi:hypothetical protein
LERKKEGNIMEKDLTIAYLDGTYDERDRWIKKIKEKITSLDEEIEYQIQYGNVATREELEFEKKIYLELLED